MFCGYVGENPKRHLTIHFCQNVGETDMLFNVRAPNRLASPDSLRRFRYMTSRTLARPICLF